MVLHMTVGAYAYLFAYRSQRKTLGTFEAHCFGIHLSFPSMLGLEAYTSMSNFFCVCVWGGAGDVNLGPHTFNK